TEYFYETVTRPREALLLTRPRIADNGAPWQASPYWEEVRRLLEVTPQRLTSRSRPAPGEAASWPELMETLAPSPEASGAWVWASERRPARCAAIEHARAMVAQRIQADPDDAGPHDGGLARWQSTFSRAFGSDHVWSASRLETYRACPFFFFIGRVLDLERREPPREGLDARQLGNIYHHILEELYRSVGVDADLASLREALPRVAEEVLDAAPREEGFRVTAWWQQTRREIAENVARSVEALESLDDSFGFYRAEQTFGIAGEPGPPLVIQDRAAGDRLQLHGYIDRIDRADGAGTPAMRVIDYKTAGPYAYTARALEEGKKLQLPLYAMAAEQALELGNVVDGFYWHVEHAEPSSFTLAKSGPQAAMMTAVEHAWAAVRGARQGHFVPRAPDDGCPGYCPAAAFCWRYEPGRWG
ncbi:MAG: PD-(D/E)XK nuclease family protein, partial [Anaerolineae bacterium]